MRGYRCYRKIKPDEEAGRGVVERALCNSTHSPFQNASTPASLNHNVTAPHLLLMSTYADGPRAHFEVQTQKLKEQ